MAPVIRRKKLSTTSSTSATTQTHLTSTTTTTTTTAATSITALTRLSPTKQSAMAVLSTPNRLRSPIRKVHGRGGLTNGQKKMIVDNIFLEMNERVRRLRAQYDVQAQALKHRIEMRINRVPKKLWTSKMGELLFQHATSAVGQSKSLAARSNHNASNSLSGFTAVNVGVKGLVEEVKRLSDGGSVNSEPVGGSKHSRKLIKGSGTSISTSANQSTDATSLRPSNSVPQLLSNSPQKQNSFSRTPLSPVKRAVSPQLSSQHSNDDRQRRRSPLRSSQQSIDPNSTPGLDKSSLKVSRSNAVKSRNFKVAPIQQAAENTNHFIKNIGSSGSLKENKVEGIKKDRVVSGGRSGKSTANGSGQSGSGGRRVLRARK